VRKTLITLALAGLFAGASASPALAGPQLPTVPKDCHEWNDLLGIDNVRDCNDPDS
jgi:hypothetical protein